MLQVFFSMEGKDLWARITGEIDMHAAGHLRRELDTSLDHARPESLLLDMKGVTFIDSSGLGVILGRYRRLKKQGGKMIIYKPAPQVLRLLQLSGLDKIMDINAELPKKNPGVMD